MLGCIDGNVSQGVHRLQRMYQAAAEGHQIGAGELQECYEGVQARTQWRDPHILQPFCHSFRSGELVPHTQLRTVGCLYLHVRIDEGSFHQLYVCAQVSVPWYGATIRTVLSCYAPLRPITVMLS